MCEAITRKQILEQYEVDENGIIRSPGKFEGEPMYVPHFFDLALSGNSDDVTEAEGVVIDYFDITEEDRILFPELKDIGRLAIMVDDQDFVLCDIEKLD